MRLVLPILLLLSTSALAEGKVRVSVESNRVAVDVPFAVNVEAEGRQVGNVILPDRPRGLKFNPRPVRHATQMVIAGNRASMKVQRTYMATATRTGRVTVPPIGVEIDGQTVFSEPLELTVTPAAPPRPPVPAETDRHEPGEGLRLEDAVFATSEVDHSEVFQQEPVRLTLSIWQLDDPAVDVEPHGPEINAPDTQGFYAVPRVPAFFARDTERRDGNVYRVVRFCQILYPTRVGELTVGEWRWEGSVRFLTRFGIQYRDLRLQSPPIVVKVKPLPQPCPQDFRGAVGRFDVRGDLTEKQVPLGMPTRLILRVTGQGNPDAIGEPVMPALEGVRIEDPVSQDTPINDPQSISVERSFIYELTPLQPGTLRIPAIPYTYFDVARKDYVTAQVGPFELEVTPSRENTQRVVVDASTAAEGRTAGPEADLAAIVFDPGTLWPRRGAGVGLAVAVASPPLAFLVLSLVMARRRRFQQDIRYARSYHARAQALRRLESAGLEFTEALYRALAGYVADKFGVPGAGLTSADVARLLEANGVGADLREGYLNVLRACERARYGGAELGVEERNALIHAAQSHIDRLENELGGSSW